MVTHHTCHTPTIVFFHLQVIKRPCLSKWMYLQAPLRNLAFQLTLVFTLSTSSVSIQMCSGISVLKHAQRESEKYRFLPTKGAQSGDKLEIWLNVYFSFQCYWDKTEGLHMEVLSELPTLTRALNLRHVSFTSVSVQIPFAYLISPFLPAHPIKTKCWFWSSCITLLPSWKLFSRFPSTIIKSKSFAWSSLYTQACSVHFLLDVSHLLRPT